MDLSDNLNCFDWSDADFWNCASALATSLTNEQLLMLGNLLLYLLTDERHPDEMIFLFDSLNPELQKRC